MRSTRVVGARRPIVSLGAWCGAVALLAGTVVPAEATTLAQAIRLVVAEHPQVAAAGLNAVAGRADIKAARAPKRPQVAVVGDFGYERSALTSRSNTAWLPGVRLSQLLYDGGRTDAEIRRRRFRADALAADRDRVLFDIVQRLSEAYLEWARQRALLKIAQEQVDAFQTLSGMTREIAQFDRGRGSDVALTATRLAQAEANRDARIAAIETARAAIRQAAAADIEPEGDVDPLDGSLPGSLAEALDTVDQHPSVRSARLKAQEADALADAAKSWWKPQFSVDAGTGSESSLAGDTKTFGAVELKLRSSLSAYDGGSGPARLASARASASAAELDATYARRSLQDEITRLWVSATNRQARLPGLEALIGISDQSRGVVAEQFRIGRRSILDVLTYELERFSARSQAESERRDLLAERYRLLSLTGRLVEVFAPAAAPTAEATPS